MHYMIACLSMRLKQLRMEKNLRQDQIASLVGVEKSSISLYENDMRQPSYEVLIRYAEVFHVSTDYLFGRSNDRTLDISGLTATEIRLVTDLVADMSSKNKKLEEFR